jgi:hypothetical protein
VANESENLWKLLLWFPGHCGNPAYHLTEYFAATSIQDAVAAAVDRYSHCRVDGCEFIGKVNFRKEALSGQ